MEAPRAARKRPLSADSHPPAPPQPGRLVTRPRENFGRCGAGRGRRARGNFGLPPIPARRGGSPEAVVGRSSAGDSERTLRARLQSCAVPGIETKLRWSEHGGARLPRCLISPTSLPAAPRLSPTACGGVPISISR